MYSPLGILIMGFSLGNPYKGLPFGTLGSLIMIFPSGHPYKRLWKPLWWDPSTDQHLPMHLQTVVLTLLLCSGQRCVKLRAGERPPTVGGRDDRVEA